MLKYHPDKGFLPGVPARDLESDEVKKYGYQRLVGSGVYSDPQPKPERKPRKTKEPETQAEE